MGRQCFTANLIRLIQGADAGMIISIAQAYVGDIPPEGEFGMGSTIAIFTMAMSIDIALGPLLSGVVVDLTNINPVFYFIASMGVVGTSPFTWFTR